VSDEGQLVADRYRLTEPIGSGAMGVVWQAYDERLHRTIALKQLLLQPGLSRADTDEARARAMREGRIAARLQHPNAVAVYDVAEHDGQPVLVMEYVPSRSLAAVLEAHGPLPPREVARIGAQVATALVAAHSAGIVHRDIKPGNVLLADDGNVKITDFGISRAVGDVTVTATGMLAGTPAYLAPEVAKGEPPGSPSDVFSLGSTLYAAVEGQPPFGLGENTLALLHAVAACRTRPAQQAGPLTALLGQMLRPSPAERPTMQDVANTLAAIAAGQHAPLTPATVPASAAPIPVPIAGPTNALAGPGRPGPTPTRLDAHPAGPSGGTSIGSPMLGPPSRPTPAADRPGVARPWRKWLLTALAIVLAALLGILVASFFTQPNTSNAANSTPPPNPITSSSAPVAPVATTTAAPTTTTTTTTTTTPTTTAPPAKPTFAQLDALAREYYGLLPGNPAGAWQLLTAKAQQQSGGFTNYQNQISKIFAIQVWTTQPHGGNGVVVTLSVETTSAQATLDRTVVTFTQQNGQLLIDGISKASKVGNGGPGGG
jgi:hypothetical protein